MDERFGNMLLSYIDKVGGFIEKAVDLAMKEVPLIIKEYLEWNFINAAIDFGVSIFWILFCGFCFYKAVTFLSKKVKWDKNEDPISLKEVVMEDPDYSPLLLLWLFVTVISFSFLSGNISNGVSELKLMLKISYAPRVFLIEEGTRLYNKREPSNKK